MITPADIENKDFSKSKKGYNEEEVDEFLDLIILDMEKLIRENKSLKQELEKVNSQVDKHISTETSVYETLEAAKTLMNDIAASAERRAEILLKNAEMEAELITREAKDNITNYSEEGLRIKNRFEHIKDRYKKMLESELERLDFTGSEIFAGFEEDFLPASMTESKIDFNDLNRLNKSEDLDKTIVMNEAKKDETKSQDLTKTMVNIR